MVTAPLVESVVSENTRTSPSASTPATAPTNAVSSSVVMACTIATGASFTAVTVMSTVAAVDVATPSLTVKVNASAPLAFAVVVYVRFGSVPLSVPFVGAATTVKVRALLSTSLPVSATSTAVSSFVFTACASATGSSFTAVGPTPTSASRAGFARNPE